MALDTLAKQHRPGVEGRRVYLTPVGAEHEPVIVRWRSDMENLHLWTGARRVPAPAELGNELAHLLSGNLTVVVHQKESLQPVGFLQAYNFSIDWGWAHVLLYFDQELTNPGMSMEGAFLFVDYLFKSFPLRKLYGDIYEYNTRMIRLLEKVGGKEEGRFEQHTWYGDRYWASVRMSLFRDHWDAHVGRLRDLIGLQQDIDTAAAAMEAARNGHEEAEPIMR